MLSLSFTAAMLGIEGYVVRVEADSAPGTPCLAIIGLPDRALNDARERVRAAIINSGFAYRRVDCSSTSRPPTFAKADRPTIYRLRSRFLRSKSKSIA